jgi:hypothetical protein
MALKPGPKRVERKVFSSRSQVEDIDRQDLWSTTYVSDRMDELPPHWHDVNNCGYALEGQRSSDLQNPPICSLSSNFSILTRAR